MGYNLCAFVHVICSREAMLRNGLLVLSASNIHTSGSVLLGIIESCMSTVRNLLYVHLVSCDISLAGDSDRHSSKPVSFGSVLCTQSVRHFVSDFYTKAAAFQQSLEVRFLLSNICSRLPQLPFPCQQRLQHGYEVVLTDLGQDFHQSVANYVTTQFPVNHAVKVIQLPDVADSSHLSSVTNRLVLSNFLFTDFT